MTAIDASPATPRQPVGPYAGGLDVEPLTGSIGAVLHGVDLTTALDDHTAAEVRAALLRWRVVFLREQPVTPGQQVAFARVFGPLTPAHPLQGGLDDEHPEVLVSRLESDHLLALLYEHMTAPERVVRWRWRAGDVAVWDNRATCHYAAADYEGARVMHRVTVAGDRPAGVAGAIDA